MTKEDRRQFIDDLIVDVHAHIAEKIEAMPDHWDGVELRRYIADQFEGSVGVLRHGYIRSHGQSKRLKAYSLDVVTNDL